MFYYVSVKLLTAREDLATVCHRADQHISLAQLALVLPEVTEVLEAFITGLTPVGSLAMVHYLDMLILFRLR